MATRFLAFCPECLASWECEVPEGFTGSAVECLACGRKVATYIRGTERAINEGADRARADRGA